MKIRLYWVFLHGGIEHIWEGRYNQRTGVATGREGHEGPWEKATVVVEGNQVTVTGEGFDGPQQGTVWRRTKELLEVEIFAGS